MQCIEHDAELLARHRLGDAPAFAELVRRHVGWVRAVARRRLKDAHLAEDVAQGVFLLLHRKSPAFGSDRALTSWLYRAAWYATEVAHRTRRRRTAREAEAGLSRASMVQVDADDQRRLAPLLDRLIRTLAVADREAILMRYQRGCTHVELGVALGISEEAARKRVGRAVERLRDLAERHSVRGTTPLLVGLLAEPARPDPPTGPTPVAPGGVSVEAASIAKGAWIMMNLTKLAAAVVAVTLLGTLGTTAWLAAARPSPAEGAPTSTAPAADPNELKRAPFTAIRWRDATPEVRVADAWYAWTAIDGLPTPRIIAHAQEQYGDSWQEHVGEDLVPLMADLGHAPGATVKLDLARLAGAREAVTMERVPMTHENRQAVRKSLQAAEGS